jgi:hypothetical protein
MNREKTLAAVMTGLVLAIHVFVFADRVRVDAWDEPGHDGEGEHSL